MLSVFSSSPTPSSSHLEEERVINSAINPQESSNNTTLRGQPNLVGLIMTVVKLAARIVSRPDYANEWTLIISFVSRKLVSLKMTLSVSFPFHSDFDTPISCIPCLFT